MSASAALLEHPFAGPPETTGAPEALPPLTTVVSPPRLSAAQARLGIVTTLEEFHDLEEPWNALFERAGRGTQLFQTFNWLWHWANHFLPAPGQTGRVTLAVVTAHIDGRLVMAWPLVSERIGPLARLAWMGEPVSQYGDVLIDDLADPLELMRAALAFVTRETGADVLQLRKVRQDSVIAPLLAEAGATVLNELAAPYLDLRSAPSFAEYEKRYSSGARRNRKRQRRRLDERGAVALEWHTGGEAARARTDEAFAFKLAWLRERGLVSPALADPRTARFFADVAHGMARPSGCHVLALTSDGHPVAIEIGLRCKGRAAIHIIAYDLSYEKTAAGALLMEDSIRSAADAGMDVFDLLAPGDPYKLEWADDAVAVRDWSLARSTLGRAYATLYLGYFRKAAKRAIDAMPLGLRRRLTGALTRGGKPKTG